MHPKHILPGMEDCQEGRVSSKTPNTWQPSQMADSSCLRISASSSKAEKCSGTDPSQESLVWLNCLLFQAGSKGSMGLKSHVGPGTLCLCEFRGSGLLTKWNSTAFVLKPQGIGQGFLPYSLLYAQTMFLNPFGTHDL